MEFNSRELLTLKLALELAARAYAESATDTAAISSRLEQQFRRQEQEALALLAYIEQRS